MSEDDFFNFEEVEERQRSPHLIPWLVTGIIAILALLLSVVVLNISRDDGKNDAEEPPAGVEEPAEPDEETPDEAPDTEVEPEPEPEVDPARPDDAIDTSHVDPGETYFLKVEWDGWHVSTEVSNKFSPWEYRLEGEGNKYLILDSELIDSLPASCEHMVDSWGLEHADDGNYKAMSPQEMCAANTSLYTEILGLVRHMEKTVKPLD